MLQRLRLLFLPWSESTATRKGSFILHLPPVVSICPPPSDVWDDFKARPQETSRDTRVGGGSERERDWDRRKEKGVFKKQEIEVYQKSSSE